MYNGIGLSTVRGSGTSGYVQRNLSHVPATKEKRKIDYKTEADLSKEEKIRGPNQGILDHEKKRKIEVKCAELEDLLVDQNLAEEEIVEKVTAYRKMLMQSVDINDKIELDDFGRPIIKATDSHQIAKMQNERNEKLKDAFGIMSQAQKDEEEKIMTERAEREENRRKERSEFAKKREKDDKRRKKEKLQDNRDKNRKEKSSNKRKRRHKSSSSSSSSSSSDSSTDSSSESSSSSDEKEHHKNKRRKAVEGNRNPNSNQSNYEKKKDESHQANKKRRVSKCLILRNLPRSLGYFQHY